MSDGASAPVNHRPVTSPAKQKFPCGGREKNMENRIVLKGWEAIKFLHKIGGPLASTTAWGLEAGLPLKKAVEIAETTASAIYSEAYRGLEPKDGFCEARLDKVELDRDYFSVRLFSNSRRSCVFVGESREYSLTEDGEWALSKVILSASVIGREGNYLAMAREIKDSSSY